MSVGIIPDDDPVLFMSGTSRPKPPMSRMGRKRTLSTFRPHTRTRPWKQWRVCHIDPNFTASKQLLCQGCWVLLTVSVNLALPRSF